MYNIEQKSTKKLNMLYTMIGRKYSIYKKIGSESFWIDYSTVNQDDKKQYSVRVYNFLNFNESEEIENEKAKIFAEIAFLKKINSENIVKIHDVYDDPKKMAVIRTNIECQSLEESVMKRKLSVEDCNGILKQLILCVQQIHDKGKYIAKLQPSSIVNKNGKYLITKIYSQEAKFEENDYWVAPQLRTKNKQKFYRPKSRAKRQKLSIWALAMLYFYMRLQNYIDLKELVKSHQDERTIFTKNMEDLCSIKSFTIHENHFLLNSLMKRNKERIGWNNFINHKMHDLINVELSRNFMLDVAYTNFCQELQERNKEQMGDVESFQNSDGSDEKDIDNDEDVEGIEKKSFSFVALSRSDIQILNEKADKSEEQEFILFKKSYFHARKCEFILKNIIIPFKNDKETNLKKKKNVEFLYLMTSRCFLDLSHIKESVKNAKRKETITKFDKKISDVYSSSCSKFNQFSQKLTIEEDKFINMTSNFFNKIIDSEEVEKKNRFLSGIQGCDFSKQEQINFTIEFVEKYKILSKFQQREEERIKCICYLMKNYRQICLLEYNESRQGKTIGQCLKEIIKQEVI